MGASSQSTFQARRSGTRVISITSGKGGVGKTTLTTQLAYEMSRTGARVLILDGDIGMANVDIMFNVHPEFTIADVLTEKCTLHEALCQVSENIWILSGGSGILGLTSFSLSQKQNLIDQVSSLGIKFDYMLIDTAPGIDEHVLYLNSAAQDICVVITPDPSSITDSYALIKVLHQVKRESRFQIICNQVNDLQEGRKLFNRFENVVGRFLPVSLEYLGSIPQDRVLRQMVQAQRLVAKEFPNSMAVVSLRDICGEIIRGGSHKRQKGGLQFFWNELLSLA